MAANLALDDELIDEAVKLGKHKSKREAVNTAIEVHQAEEAAEGSGSDGDC